MRDRTLCVPPIVFMLVLCPQIVAAPQTSQQPVTPAGISVSLQFEDREGENVAGQPSVTRARYDVDVYGGTAVGTLSLEFENTSDQDLSTTYSINVPADFEIGSVAVDIGGRITELEMKPGKSASPSAISSPTLR